MKFSARRLSTVTRLSAKDTSQAYPAPDKNICGDRLSQQKHSKSFMMPQMMEGRKDEVEARIQQPIQHYKTSDKASLRLSAEKFGIAYSTLRGRLNRRQAQARRLVRWEALSEYEEKSIVRWCERLEEWGHPARMAVVKGMVEGMVTRRVKDRTLGKNLVTRSLRQHPWLAAKLGTRLDRQRVLASDPVLLKDHLSKV